MIDILKNWPTCGALWLMEEPAFLENNKHAVLAELRKQRKIPPEVIDDLCMGGVWEISAQIIEMCGAKLTEAQLQNACLKPANCYDQLLLCKKAESFIKVPATDLDKALCWNIEIRRQVARETCDPAIIRLLAKDKSSWVIGALLQNAAMPKRLLVEITEEALRKKDEQVLRYCAQSKLNDLPQNLQSQLCLESGAIIRIVCVYTTKNPIMFQAMIDLGENEVIETSVGNKLFDRKFIRKNITTKNEKLLHAFAESKALSKMQALTLAKTQDQRLIELLMVHQWHHFSKSAIWSLLNRVSELMTLSSVVSALEKIKSKDIKL